MTGCRSHDDAASLACLAGLPGISPGPLASLLSHHSVHEAVAVARGDQPARGPIAKYLAKRQKMRTNWPAAVRERPPAWYLEALERSSTTVLRPGDLGYPPQLVDDPRRPPVLFVRGDLTCLASRRVGVVGTRNCTHQGRGVARRLGRDLAEAGVVVVSGLALGIDGASHEGALSAEGGRPAAVVGSGPDMPYPKRHSALWDTVIERGVLVSEWPPGAQPEAYRFPLRNRILAALSEVLVVVESRERGGSLITAREAGERGVGVFAVPGSLNSPASVGAIQLIRDGANIFTEAADVFTALDLDTSRAGSRSIDTRQPPGGVAARALEECRSAPLTLERAALVLDLGVGEAALALARLERTGWLREVGGWYEPADE